MPRALPFLLAILSACSSTNIAETTPAPQTVRVVGSGGSASAIAIGMSASAPDARATQLPATAADTWRVLPAAFESLSIPLSMIDSTTRVAGNAGFNVRRRLGSTPMVRLIDCGTTQGGPSAETYDVRLTITSQVKEAEGGGSSLLTTVEAMAKPVAFSGEYIRCSSTGALEARIADAVKARLTK
jgi:hypothetical protein